MSHPAPPSRSQRQAVPTRCFLKQKRIVLKSRCGRINASSRRHLGSTRTSVRSLPPTSSLNKRCNNDPNSHSKLVDGQSNTMQRGPTSSIAVSQVLVTTECRAVTLLRSCQDRWVPRQVELGTRSGGSRARLCQSRGRRCSTLEAP